MEAEHQQQPGDPPVEGQEGADAEEAEVAVDEETLAALNNFFEEDFVEGVEGDQEGGEGGFDEEGQQGGEEEGAGGPAEPEAQPQG